MPITRRQATAKQMKSPRIVSVPKLDDVSVPKLDEQQLHVFYILYEITPLLSARMQPPLSDTGLSCPHQIFLSAQLVFARHHFQLYPAVHLQRWQWLSHRQPCSGLHPELLAELPTVETF